jgi:hypothetical protein
VNLIGQPQPQGSRRLEIIPGETQAERTKRLRASAQAARRVANRNRVALLQFACKYPMPDFKDLDNPLYNLKIDLPNIQCQHCHAYRFPKEAPGICCGKGAVSLELPKLPSEIVWKLFTGEHEHSKFFKEHIRAFNQALAFASLRAQQDHLPPGGPPTFRIHGQVYHNLGPLLANENESPKFMQIYFHDSEDRTLLRLNAVQLNSPGPASEIMELLENEVRSNSPWVSMFTMAIERMISCPEVKIVLHAEKRPRDAHERIYNEPTGSEIGVMMPGNLEEMGTECKRDFIMHYRDNSEISVKAMNITNR